MLFGEIIKLSAIVKSQKKAAEKANKANNAEFYFGFDEVICPEKYN